MIEQYNDFEIRIGARHDGEYPVEVDSPAGEASGTFYQPFDAQELDEIMARVQASDTDQGFLKEVGGRLYAALFAGPVKTLLAESQGMCGEENGLRLRLRIGPAELAVLPWEFMYDEERGKFLALLPQTVLTRHIAILEPMRSLKAQQIRLLVAIASPKRLPSLDVEKEKQRLLEALEPLIQQNLARVEFLEGTTMSRLMDKLREEFNVLHFIGHGDLDEETGQGYLCFEDEWGGTNPVDGQTLGHLLENSSVRLVTLNTCKSAQLTEREARLSMAPALLAAGVPAVVAMQTEIPDETAVIFAREFYRSLAYNRPVGAALTEARNVIQCTLGMENVDWAIPVLYDRSVDGRILDLERPRTWREVWLTVPRLIAVAVGLVAFAAVLLRAIPGFQSPSPTPTPTVTPSPTVAPSPTITPLPTVTPSPTPIPSPTATPLAFPTAKPDEILIIVAQFDAQRSSQEYDISRHIVDDLESNLQTVKVGGLRVERIAEVVPDSEVARRLGEVYGATLVIWGWYDSAALTPHYEVISKEGQIQQVDLGKFVARSTQPDGFRFYVARDLPRGMTYLSSFTIGQIYYSRQEWQDALDFATKAVEIIPEVVGSIPEVETSGLENLYVLRGNIYEQLGEHEEAIADFNQAIDINPDYAHAYVGSGAAYVNLGQKEAGLADLDRAISLDDSIPEAYFDRGTVKYHFSEFEEALLDINRAIELDPTYHNAYLVRGLIYCRLEDVTQAMTDMDRVVSMAPNNPLGYVYRAGLYIDAEEYEKAEADLTKALDLDPGKWETVAQLGWAYFRQQKYAQAVELNERAIEIKPNRTEPRFTLAACLLALGQTEQALAENRQAIAINLSPMRARNAIDDLEWLREVQPDTPGLDQMMQEIQASLEKLE
jgi:tetratricopeptide (TPR) repeat protein